ncbi:hypothetical protein GHT06_021866 [Daphnia sinensis]|uniref:Uncharacterized protein n=1 Tax=Daphnia sinensis TaxID=1820382 RepID=A0AAD5PN28_9CRUS|nr:hypothetical protein GHT06_021866 [Daphnia sinensis]
MEATAMNEFQSVKLSVREFSEAKFKMLEDIRAIQIEIKVVQQRSFRLRNELREGRTRYEEFVSHCDELRKRLLQLSDYQLEIPCLQSRYNELAANLNSKNQENAKQLDCLKADFAKQQNETASEYARKVEEKRQQLERELSSFRSDLAAHDEERILREQARRQNDELECLRATIAIEMEQEKETAHHNCELKAQSLKTTIQELESKINKIRQGV